MIKKELLERKIGGEKSMKIFKTSHPQKFYVSTFLDNIASYLIMFLNNHIYMHNNIIRLEHVINIASKLL